MYHQYYYPPSSYYNNMHNNLSLARQTANLSKANRQVVPAFLQKLFEMVNDPSNADLIRWSDQGDSFFVLDHDRFARQVLGRWFKHQNFSSFVRQLNMYGFHKIPHLQQGVLRSDQEAEFWNFEHPNFHRGQPDLLCLIQRKKQAPQSNDDPSDHTIPSSLPNHSPQSTSLPDGQLLDIHSIINGIAAIKRHQSSISAELNQLKRSNQLLWQESLAARQRHQKHQDTINRILKFLAGVFGNGPPHTKDTVVAASADALGMAMGTSPIPGDPARNDGYHPKQVQRLMIEEGPNANKRKMPVVQVEEEEEDDDDDAPYLRDLSPVSLRSAYNEPMSPTTLSEPPYINLTSPRDISSTPQIIMQPKPSPSRTLPTANSLAAALSPALSTTSPDPTTSNSTSNANGNNTTALTALSPSPPLPVDQDGMIQAFQQMLTSPSQIQRLLAAISAHNGNANAGGGGVGLPAPLPQQIQQQQGQSAYGGQGGAGAYGAYDALPPSADHYTPSGQLSLLTPSPPPSLSPMGVSPEEREQQQRLEKTWKVTQDIDKDVNALHSSIESLIGAFGLDPGLMAAGVGGNGVNGATMDGAGMINSGNGQAGMGGGGLANGQGMEDLAVPEFDFDAFLNEYGNTGIGMNGMGGIGGVGGDGDVDMELGNGGGVGMSRGFEDGTGTVGNGSVVSSPVVSFAGPANIGGNGSGGGTMDGNGASAKKAKVNGRGRAHASSISSVSSLGGGGMSGIEAASAPASPTASTLPVNANSRSAGGMGSPKGTKGRKRKSDAAEIEDMQRGMGGSVLGGMGVGTAGAAGTGGVTTGNANGNAGGGAGKRKR